jgi:hypothetical protein
VPTEQSSPRAWGWCVRNRRTEDLVGLLFAKVWRHAVGLAVGVTTCLKKHDLPQQELAISGNYVWRLVVLDEYSLTEDPWDGYFAATLRFHSTVPVPVDAAVNITPDTLDLKNSGKWITCYIELPDGYDV